MRLAKVTGEAVGRLFIENQIYIRQHEGAAPMFSDAQYNRWVAKIPRDNDNVLDFNFFMDVFNWVCYNAQTAMAQVYLMAWKTQTLIDLLIECEMAECHRETLEAHGIKGNKILKGRTYETLGKDEVHEKFVAAVDALYWLNGFVAALEVIGDFIDIDGMSVFGPDPSDYGLIDAYNNTLDSIRTLYPEGHQVNKLFRPIEKDVFETPLEARWDGKKWLEAKGILRYQDTEFIKIFTDPERYP